MRSRWRLERNGHIRVLTGRHCWRVRYAGDIQFTAARRIAGGAAALRAHSVNRPDKPAEAQPKLYQVAGLRREKLPIPDLRRHVDRVWTNELRGSAQIEVVPDGCIDIYWTGSRLQIAGPNTRVVTTTITGAAELVGVRFRPGVACRWLGAPAAELLNTHPPLEDVWAGAERRGCLTSSLMPAMRRRPRQFLSAHSSIVCIGWHPAIRS